MQFDFKSSPILLKDSHTQEKADNDKMKRRREKKRTSRSETTNLSPENKSSYCLRKRDPSSNPLRSFTPPEMRRTRSEKRDSNTAKNSCRESKEDLIFLTEVSFIFQNMLLPNIFTIFVFYNSEASPRFDEGKKLCCVHWAVTSFFVSPGLLFEKGI
jgi:hypothetical protein